MQKVIEHKRSDATHMGTSRITRNMVLMKRGKRGQWLRWQETRKGGRWEGVDPLSYDTNPIKFKKEVKYEA